MLEAQHVTADAQAKGSYALPEEFDGTVNEQALYYAVRAYRNNRRQGTASTKTRAEVSGGGRKPWRQKGTGRARQGTIRAPQWAGGGVVFGPKPRSHRTDLPRKVRQLARRSALNQRAREEALIVIEALSFEGPKTKQLVQLLDALDIRDRNVLLLTADHRPDVYLSGRNVPGVHVMRYADASAYEILWAETVVVEEGGLGGHHVEGSEPRPRRAPRTKRAKKTAGAGSTRAAKAGTRTKRATTTKKTTKKTKKTTSRTKTKRSEEGDDA